MIVMLAEKPFFRIMMMSAHRQNCLTKENALSQGNIPYCLWIVFYKHNHHAKQCALFTDLYIIADFLMTLTFLPSSENIDELGTLNVSKELSSVMLVVMGVIAVFPPECLKIPFTSWQENFSAPLAEGPLPSLTIVLKELSPVVLVAIVGIAWLFPNEEGLKIPLMSRRGHVFMPGPSLVGALDMFGHCERKGGGPPSTIRNSLKSGRQCAVLGRKLAEEPLTPPQYIASRNQGLVMLMACLNCKGYWKLRISYPFVRRNDGNDDPRDQRRSKRELEIYFFPLF